eukprot:gene8664-6090_t
MGAGGRGPGDGGRGPGDGSAHQPALTLVNIYGHQEDHFDVIRAVLMNTSTVASLFFSGTQHHCRYYYCFAFFLFRLAFVRLLCEISKAFHTR